MIPAEHKPSKLFAKMFLQGSPRDVRRQRQRLAEGRSILDLVGEQTKALQGNVSRNDRRQLDSILHLFVRLRRTCRSQKPGWIAQAKSGHRSSQRYRGEGGFGRPVSSWFKMIPLILQTDSSRVISMVFKIIWWFSNQRCNG